MWGTRIREASSMSVTSTRPRFTIERLRTLVLIGGALLVAAIGIFLAVGQWKLHRIFKDLPGRLGINIEQSANGVNYTGTRKGKTTFKLHAAKAIKRKDDGSMQLQDVRIELYGEDGTRSDTISGNEFEYNTKLGRATAAGAVEITLMRPGVKPAIAQLKSGSKPQPRQEPAATTSAGQDTDSEIHVKTSGLVFDQKSGLASTTQRVDFTLQQGTGNAVGASYDSAKGQLILDRSVELHIDRLASQSSIQTGIQAGKGPITVRAGHADFQHANLLCLLTQAVAEYTGGRTQIANATLHFRDDGSVVRLDGAGGVDLATDSGGHVTAPTGVLEFDESNHPHQGMLSGGAHLEMNEPTRHLEGTSPTAQLAFDRFGQLQSTHLAQGVVFKSQQQGVTAKGAATQVSRSWTSQTADIAFAPASSALRDKHAAGKMEPRTIHGYGGVVVTSESVSDGVVTPSKLTADTVVAELADGGAITSLSGDGHASFDERTASGAHQASSADRLEVRFLPNPVPAVKTAAKPREAGGGSQIASIVEIGNVVLVQDPPQGGAGQKGSTGAGKSASQGSGQSTIRATASRADYDGQSEVLHLTGTPRVRDGALDLTAERIDFARASGDAFAHGDVRASWTGSSSLPGSTNQPTALPGTSLLGGASSSGNGPVHAVAAEAELHQATEEVVFRGGASGKTASGEPRLWQAANSVSAPVITLNRKAQTLTAEAGGAANPVRMVLVSYPGETSATAGAKGKPAGPSIIRVRSGDLHYAEGDRLALFHSGSVGSVTAETTGKDGAATVVSQDEEVKLLPAGSATKSSPASSNTSVDRLTARGHVTVDWPDRKGTGEKLVYQGADGKFTLTGTPGSPPRITDQTRGTVTGAALIFNSRDDSVTVEGDGQKTVTETHSPK